MGGADEDRCDKDHLLVYWSWQEDLLLNWVALVRWESIPVELKDIHL